MVAILLLTNNYAQVLYSLFQNAQNVENVDLQLSILWVL